MKANKAPEKIYIQSFNVSEEDAKFDKSKLFFDDIWVEKPEPGAENIEYVRKDVFIERASKWIYDNAYLYVDGQIDIEDFKNYIKGE